MTKDELNSQAYDDVLDQKYPSRPYNEVYMERYRFWVNIAGPKHFDPYYDLHDYED